MEEKIEYQEEKLTIGIDKVAELTNTVVSEGIHRKQFLNK